MLAIPVMYWLSRRKLSLADELNSRSLRADAVESVTCGWLALVVVMALLAQLAIGAWWLDAVASLGIVWFLIREGREAWSGDDSCAHRHLVRIAREFGFQVVTEGLQFNHVPVRRLT